MHGLRLTDEKPNTFLCIRFRMLDEGVIDQDLPSEAFHLRAIYEPVNGDEPPSLSHRKAAFVANALH
jgi:hypothetical protein